ncbi:MAG TPA: hypothetical protein VN281_18460 [Verrucomicrobiae bacterium]|nr:hypothetical protein [Verrucomicrobiae bacterium]
MDLIFNCPKCGQELEVDASGAGEEIGCPSCGSVIQIPAPQPEPVAEPAVPAGSAWAPEGQHAPTIASSAAAKVKMQLKVPVHSTPTEKLIAKPLVPLEIAAKESDRQLRVKTIRHIDCVEVGRDRFDEMVTTFLGKVGESNVVSVTTLAYSHIDVSSQKLITDYGVLVMYRG